VKEGRRKRQGDFVELTAAGSSSAATLESAGRSAADRIPVHFNACIRVFVVKRPAFSHVSLTTCLRLQPPKISDYVGILVHKTVGRDGVAETRAHGLTADVKGAVKMAHGKR
jgi:hypothetical protein